MKLYDDDRALIVEVASWLGTVARGGAAIAVCTPEHAASLRTELREMGPPAALAESEGRLLILDAETTLEGFLQGGALRGAAFKQIARQAIARVREATPASLPRVRAWGEMVDILWRRGEYLLVDRLEELWNEVIAELDIELLCSYPVDDLHHASHGDGGALSQVCTSHSRLIPAHDPLVFEQAVSHALATVFSPEEAPKLRAVLGRRPELRTSMPRAERVLIGLHMLDPLMGRRVLDEARLFLAR